MSIIIVILIAISLSMDAFSLSLAYGTLGQSKKYILLLSGIVGIFHFFMPLLGMNIGTKILSFIKIPPELLVLIILTVIGLQMILSKESDNKEIKVMNFIELFSFAFAVSIDSFSVGLGLKTIYKNPIICSFIFMLSSYIFTNLGLKMGKQLNEKLGNISTRIGGFVLILIGIIYMFS